MALCPRCQQPLPDPPERFCPHCGAELLPVVRSTPWEQRDRIGLVSALVETTQQVFTRPTEFFRAMPVTGGIGGPPLLRGVVGYLGPAAPALFPGVFPAPGRPRPVRLPPPRRRRKFL